MEGAFPADEEWNTFAMLGEGITKEWIESLHVNTLFGMLREGKTGSWKMVHPVKNVMGSLAGNEAFKGSLKFDLVVGLPCGRVAVRMDKYNAGVTDEDVYDKVFEDGDEDVYDKVFEDGDEHYSQEGPAHPMPAPALGPAPPMPVEDFHRATVFAPSDVGDFPPK